MSENSITSRTIHPFQSALLRRVPSLRMILGLAIALLGLGAPSAAADSRLSTVSVPSSSMSKTIDTAIMLPTSYASSPGRKYSVIYFLDGYNTGGRDGIRIFYDWYKYDLLRSCDKYDVIMVAVGCSNKWYFDSPVDPTVKWQTFLINELIPYVDSNYRSVGTRQGRAITGLSMGGFGSFYTAFRHTDTFIAAGSTSGGVDFRPFPTNWDIAAVLGAEATHQSVWDANVVVNNLSALPSAGMGICFDCATNDGFFSGVNAALDAQMTTNSIPHTYNTSTDGGGGHTTAYWGTTFPKHVDFFSKYLTALTRGSVVMRVNTVKTFAATDYPFANAGNPTNAIKVVTSLPSHGTLTLSGTPVTLGAVVSAASIGTLIYTPAANYIGSDSFNFQVSDNGTAFSSDAVMAISVVSNTAVMNGSFETPGTTQSGPWATFGSPWTGNPAANYYQQVQVVPPYSSDYTSTVDNGMWAAVLTPSSATAAIPLSQSLPKTVSAADTLSVTFALGRPQSAAAGGQCVAYFQVGSTKYTTTYDTSLLQTGSWQTYTMTQQISNSGNLSVGFYWISGDNSNVDSIGEVTVTPGVVDPNAPSLTNPVLTALEDAVTPLSTGSFGYADRNSAALAAVQITALPALGTLKNGGAIVGSGNLPLTVAVADLGNLTYQSALHGSGAPYTTIGIKVMNANNLWSLPATMTINVTHVNHAPTSASAAVSMAKSTVRTFTSADIPFADADTGDALGAIKVTSLPVQGVLKLNGTPITTVPSAAILAASIGTLTYTPVASYLGADSFNYQVRDAALFSADATMALSIIDGTIIPVINGNFETEYGSNTDKTINWVKFNTWDLDNTTTGSVSTTGAFTSAADPDGGSKFTRFTYNNAGAEQNLNTTVSAGDTLSVTFNLGVRLNPGGSWTINGSNVKGTAYFLVGSSTYSMPYDLTGQTAGAWYPLTFTTTITNSGNLSIGFKNLGVNNSYYTSLDGVSNVTRTSSGGTPTITTSGTLSALSTTYGTASSPASITVGGANMTAGILVTAPTGFEVSQASGSGYGSTTTVGSAGTIATTPVYVRLAATAPVGSYNSQNMVLTSNGATSVNVSSAASGSTVSKAALTLTANNQNKLYGTTQTTPVTGSSAFTASGLKNGETVGTVTLTYASGGLLATDALGSTSTITPSAAAAGTFSTANYTVGYVAGTLTVSATPPPAAATGGTLTTYTSGGLIYNVHTFTSSGTFTVTSGVSVNYLVVGGGGGGGSSTGGGGGAGQVATGTLSATPQSYPVTIGSGGNGGNPGAKGADSGFGGVTGRGGDGGTCQTTAHSTSLAVYSTWGSGGGGGYDSSIPGGLATPGQGYAGGKGGNDNNFFNGGGGGGAGGAGGDAVNASHGGNGGSGISSSITGSAVYYGGGGGGGIFRGTGNETQGLGGLGGGGNGNVFSGAAATAGSPNTGGGGGGGGNNSSSGNGGAGGSGVVIISYISGSAGPAPGSYAAWAATNGIIGAANLDSNHDGVQNGIAYFMGVTGFVTLPRPNASGMIAWPMSATFSGTYAVQTSPNLATWTTVSTQAPAGGFLSYTLPAGQGRLFVRLVVTPN